MSFNEVNEMNFNETCKGYVIRACKITGYNEEQIEKILDGLRFAFDEMTMEDARKEYEEY